MNTSRILVGILLVGVATSPSWADDSAISGRWKGYFYQVPGGLITPGNYYAEATLKQEKDVVTGEITIAMAAKPESFHTMTVRGKTEKGLLVVKDEKVVESTPVASRWFTDRTFSGRVSHLGTIVGTWTDPSVGSGKGTFSFVRMDYSILIKRDVPDTEGLIPGKLYLNGVELGNVYENAKHVIPPGQYSVRRRITSEKNFVQGPTGLMGKRGDFLLEITGVPKRSDILIRPGNKAELSKGSILAGSAAEEGRKILAPSLLAKLRLYFYGTDKPTFANPVYNAKEKGIVIRIEDYRNDSSTKPRDLRDGPQD